MTNSIKKIERLVDDVAREALKLDTNGKMDALKLLQPYYAILKKAQGRPEEFSDEDKTTMGGLRDRLRVVEGHADD